MQRGKFPREPTAQTTVWEIRLDLKEEIALLRPYYVYMSERRQVSRPGKAARRRFSSGREFRGQIEQVG